MRFRAIWLRAIPLFLLGASGCGVVIPVTRSEKKLARLEVGMEKNEVLRALGDPDTVRGGQGTTVVHQYELYKKSTPWLNGLVGPLMLTIPWWWPSYFDFGRGNIKSIYWMVYRDGKLSQWGREGDWASQVPQSMTIIKQDFPSSR